MKVLEFVISLIIMVILIGLILFLTNLGYCQEGIVLPKDWDGRFIPAQIDGRTVYVASEEYALGVIKAMAEKDAQLERKDAECEKISDVKVKAANMDCEIRLDACSKRCDLMIATVGNKNGSVWENPQFNFFMGALT